MTVLFPGIREVKKQYNDVCMVSRLCITLSICISAYIVAQGSAGINLEGLCSYGK